MTVVRESSSGERFSVLSRLAADELGGWRFFLRGELRELARALAPGERVQMMAVGQLEGGGSSRGLVAVTDRRLLILTKRAFRRCRFDEVSWQHVRSISVTAKTGGTAKLDLGTAAGTTKLTTVRAAWAKQIARLVAEHVPGVPLSVEAGAGDLRASAAGSPTRDSRRSRGPTVRILSILAWAAAGFLVFQWPFGSDPDRERRRAPTFAAGGCTTQHGTVVSCDDTSKAFLEIVARPAGARRCRPDSRLYSRLVRRKVVRRLEDRRLCLDILVPAED